jgi:hypothetical protein
MFITCNNCKAPFTCTDRDTCRIEEDYNTLPADAEKIWNLIYPDRRKWDELEQGTRDEWIKFTKAARTVIRKDC